MAILSSKMDVLTILFACKGGNVIEDAIDKIYRIMGRTELKNESVVIDQCALGIGKTRRKCRELRE